MHKCQTSVRMVVATGELAAGDFEGGLSGAARDDVRIKPVGMLREKIEAVGRLLEDYRGGTLSPSLLFFFPRHLDNGEETGVVCAEALKTLTALYKSYGVTLRLRPVSTLREAVRVLGVQRLPPSRLDRVLTGSLFAVLAMAGMAGMLHWLSWRPIPIQFESIQLKNGSLAPSPVRAVHRPNGAWEKQDVCTHSSGLPLFAAGDKLILSISAGGNYVAIASVSEQSGVKVFPPKTWEGGQPPGGGSNVVSVELPIEAPPEKGKIMVLAQRFFPFDTEKLRARLTAAMDGKPPAERVNAAVNSLVKEAPGYRDYSFLTVEGKPDCANE
jgi:hypothetical protein